MKAKTRLFVDACHLKSVIKKYGFRFTSMRLETLKGGWLRASVDWTADKDSYLFKYCCADGQCFSVDESSQDLSFTILSKRFKTSFRIGICKNLAKKNFRGLDHQVSHFQNTKYGVVVYFAPKHFDQPKNVLESYEFDEKGKEIVDRTIQK